VTPPPGSTTQEQAAALRIQRATRSEKQREAAKVKAKKQAEKQKKVDEAAAIEKELRLGHHREGISTFKFDASRSHNVKELLQDALDALDSKVTAKAAWALHGVAESGAKLAVEGVFKGLRALVIDDEYMQRTLIGRATKTFLETQLEMNEEVVVALAGDAAEQQIASLRSKRLAKLLTTFRAGDFSWSHHPWFVMKAKLLYYYYPSDETVWYQWTRRGLWALVAVFIVGRVIGINDYCVRPPAPPPDSPPR